MQECGISIHPFVSSLICVIISISEFSKYIYFVFLGRLIPRYFYSFWCNGKWDCFFHFSFWSLLLVYGNVVDLCIFILYCVPLLNSLMSSSSFLVGSLGSSMYDIMSSANSDSFTSFPIWISFISFSFLIVVAKTSKTMLNNSHKSGILVFFPDLRKNAFSFPYLSMIFAVGLSYMVFIMLRCVPSLLTFWRNFVINGCWILSKAFSACFEMIISFLFFNLLMWCITLIDLQMKKIFHPWGKSHLIMVYNSLNVLLDLDCLYFVEDFCVYVHQWYWPVVLFIYLFLVSLSDFCIRMMVASLNEFESIPSFTIFWNTFRIGINSSLNVRYNSPVVSSGPGLLFLRSFYITVSISVLVIGLFIFSISSSFSLGRLCLSKNLYICSRLSILLAYNCL